MKTPLWSLFCSLFIISFTQAAPSKSTGKNATVTRGNLVGIHVAREGKKFKKLTLSARGKCSFMGASGEWKVRNDKGILVSKADGEVTNGEVEVFLPSIRLRCYFRVNPDVSLAAYAVTGFGAGKKTLYNKPVVYKKN